MNLKLIINEQRLDYKLIRYKFNISYEWTFKWMNSMALASMIGASLCDLYRYIL